jgi:spermidine/putrescine transport system permease protein
MESWRKNPVVFWVLNAPGAIWLLAFFIVPLAIVWFISFGEKRGVVDIEITWTLANYARAVEPLYLEIFWKSILMAGGATVACLVVGYPVAFAIAFAPDRWKPVLLMAVVLPFWINALIRTYALIAVFRSRGFINFGLEWLWEKANAVLSFVGLSELQLLGERFEPLPLLYNNTAVTLGIVYAFFPFMVLPLYANIEKMDRSYIEASLDLGASQWRTFISVTFPLTWHGVLSGIIIVFIPALGAFFIPDLLGGTDSQLIGNVIERQFKSANDWPFGGALSFLLMYLTFGALALRSLSGRGGKGLEA